jgi:NADPH:quinone reductase-like Zn-dependent oxidoreductase
VGTGGRYPRILVDRQAIQWLLKLIIADPRHAAFQALFLVADMQAGQRVLIHAGASGVGVAANQLAKGFGAKEVYSTAG